MTCMRAGMPMKAVVILGQSTPYGTDALPIISTPGTFSRAVTYIGGPRNVNATDVACTFEKQSGNVGETPASGLGTYLANKATDAMGNETPQYFVSTAAQPAIGIKYMQPPGSEWEKVEKHISALSRMKLKLEAPNAEIIALVLMHGELDKKMDTAQYLKGLANLVDGIQKAALSSIGQTSPMRLFVFQNSNHAFYGNMQETYLRVTTQGLEQATHLMIGPTYFLGRSSPKQSIHLSGYGTYVAGVYAARAIYQFTYENRVPDHIRPLEASRDGAVITIRYRVPTLPLVRKDVVYPGNNPGGAKLRYKNDGYTVGIRPSKSGDNMKKYNIENVEIVGDTVRLTCEAIKDFKGPIAVAYAVWDMDMVLNEYGYTLGGNVCDSTPEPYTTPWGEVYTLCHWMPNHVLDL